MASDSTPTKRKRRGPYLQYLQAPNPLTAMPQRTRFRYLSEITRSLREFSYLANKHYYVCNNIDIQLWQIIPL